MLTDCIFILASAIVISLDDSFSLKKLFFRNKTVLGKKTFVIKKPIIKAPNK
ncbi:hypothetical protein MCM1_2630 [Methanosarcina barkeri CM1]|uniref:Uncharacterized protein n=1 Tax=Methanosarcina barkeri CM1 TaxID=796385 RepID=A0A0G3CCH5_METBA|nr:hypothetical protein MCM1_2630 [Methanosarcina barkeri CM1]